MLYHWHHLVTEEWVLSKHPYNAPALVNYNRSILVVLTLSRFFADIKSFLVSFLILSRDPQNEGIQNDA